MLFRVLSVLWFLFITFVILRDEVSLWLIVLVPFVFGVLAFYRNSVWFIQYPWPGKWYFFKENKPRPTWRIWGAILIVAVELGYLALAMLEVKIQELDNDPVKCILAMAAPIPLVVALQSRWGRTGWDISIRNQIVRVYYQGSLKQTFDVLTQAQVGEKTISLGDAYEVYGFEGEMMHPQLREELIENLQKVIQFHQDSATNRENAKKREAELAKSQEHAGVDRVD